LAFAFTPTSARAAFIDNGAFTTITNLRLEVYDVDHFVNMTQSEVEQAIRLLKPAVPHQRNAAISGAAEPFSGTEEEAIEGLRDLVDKFFQCGSDRLAPVKENGTSAMSADLNQLHALSCRRYLASPIQILTQVEV
jgi:hypothetical protein